MVIQALRVHQVVWLMVFTFPILSFNDGFAQKLLHIIVLSVCIAALYFDKVKPKVPVAFFKVFFHYFIVVILYYISISLYQWKGLSSSSIPDLVRPVIYALYFIFPIFFLLRGKDDVERLFKLLVLAAVIQIAFSFLVFIPETYSLVDIYKGRKSDDSVIMHFYRFSGTYIYPSDFSMFLSLFVYFYFFKFVAFNGLRVKEWGITFIVLLGIVMTISRGGIGSIGIMLIFCYFFSSAKYNFKVNIVILIFLSMLSLLILYLFSNDLINEESLGGMYYIFAMLDSGEGVDGSTLHRLNEFSLGLQFAAKYFPLGGGADRDAISLVIPIVESFYGHHLIKWGFTGLILAILFNVLVSMFYLQTLKKLPKTSFEAIFLKSIFVYMWSVPLIFGFSSAMSDRFKTLPTYYLLVGLGMAICYLTEKSINESKNQRAP
ncbi:hypothetical protein C1E24_19730 [Pseudoalteromonas phenolica]|uniref:O-antigen polymerase n=1 Tax=Pseudoalteromonas phenolica TaxID=161398 RepID=A0A5R9PY39_9GAMM|nr:hypothetical protein [Pseudoalteromonas phenolica]TLX45312.1 hypothetical protein C1E24_19730 [Pseudoalteromonas phenolica]